MVRRDHGVGAALLAVGFLAAGCDVSIAELWGTGRAKTGGEDGASAEKTRRDTAGGGFGVREAVDEEGTDPSGDGSAAPRRRDTGAERAGRDAPGDSPGSRESIGEEDEPTVDFCMAPSGRGTGKAANPAVPGAAPVGGPIDGEKLRKSAERIAEGFTVEVGDRSAVAIDPDGGGAVRDLETGQSLRITIYYRDGEPHSSFAYDVDAGSTPCLRHKAVYNTFWTDEDWSSCGPCSDGE